MYVAVRHSCSQVAVRECMEMGGRVETRLKIHVEGRELFSRFLTYLFAFHLGWCFCVDQS